MLVRLLRIARFSIDPSARKERTSLEGGGGSFPPEAKVHLVDQPAANSATLAGVRGQAGTRGLQTQKADVRKRNIHQRLASPWQPEVVCRTAVLQTFSHRPQQIRRGPDRGQHHDLKQMSVHVGIVLLIRGRTTHVGVLKAAGGSDLHPVAASHTRRSGGARS